MTTTTIDVDLDKIPRHSVTLDAQALVTAVRAVHPHTNGTEDFPGIHRIRVDITDGVLELLATSRHTAVIARIDGDPALDFDAGDEPWTVDLFPGDLADIAKMFKPSKDEQLTLRIDFHKDDRVTVTDASGLFDGRAYTVPSVGHPEDFPNIRQTIANTMKAERGIVGTVTYTGELLRRFAASAGVYGDALHVEPTAENRPFVVTVGDNFIGLLMPQRNSEEITTEQAKVRSTWWTRLDEWLDD